MDMERNHQGRQVFEEDVESIDDLTVNTGSRSGISNEQLRDSSSSGNQVVLDGNPSLDPRENDEAFRNLSVEERLSYLDDNLPGPGRNPNEAKAKNRDIPPSLGDHKKMELYQTISLIPKTIELYHFHLPTNGNIDNIVRLGMLKILNGQDKNKLSGIQFEGHYLLVSSLEERVYTTQLVKGNPNELYRNPRPKNIHPSEIKDKLFHLFLKGGMQLIGENGGENKRIYVVGSYGVRNPSRKPGISYASTEVFKNTIGYSKKNGLKVIPVKFT